MKRRAFLSALGGAVLAWPLAARAQQKAMPAIGVLSGRSPGEIDMALAALRQGLGDTGFVEGQNLTIEYRYAEGHYDRFPALAADLVARKVAVIAAVGGPQAARAAKDASSTIPIVFQGGDPVEYGLVASLARPGGNITGVIFPMELNAKRLDLLTELVPRARVIALLINPTQPRQVTAGMPEAARAKGLQLAIVKASTEGELDAAFASLAGLHADALIVANDTFFLSRHAQIVALAARYAVPAIFPAPEFTGGLISYSPDYIWTFRLVGTYVGRILKGEKPADLPVQQPTKFELVVNLKTAKALGLTVPQTILAFANEVIE